MEESDWPRVLGATFICTKNQPRRAIFSAGSPGARTSAPRPKKQSVSEIYIEYKI